MQLASRVSRSLDTCDLVSHSQTINPRLVCGRVDDARLVIMIVEE